MIDCILLDMNMPHMDGAQTLQEIQRIRPGARVVLMSGHDEQEIASQFTGQTLASVLPKPFSPAMLREHVRRAIGAPGAIHRDLKSDTVSDT
jgi:DNA-binding NtrC family response regulator